MEKDSSNKKGERTAVSRKKLLVAIAVLTVSVLCLSPFISLENDSCVETTFEKDGYLFKVIDQSVGEVGILQYNGSEKQLKIPSKTNYNDVTYDVKSIFDKAFKDNIGLTSLIIPDTITLIGESAFEGCDGLKELTIPISLDSISDMNNPAFKGCNNIEGITYTPGSGIGFGYTEPYHYHLTPSGISSTNLTSVVLSEGVTHIPDEMFKDCIALKDVKFPSHLECLGEHAFMNCTSLETLTLPDSITFMDTAVFRDCTSLASVTIPEGIQRLSYWTFFGCTSLTDVHLNEGLTYIGGYAFKNCTSLESIVIPETTTTLGAGAFRGCMNLREITLPINLDAAGRYVSTTFEGCTFIEKVTFTKGTGFAHDYSKGKAPPWVMSKDVFQTLVLPEGIESIGDYMFNGCKALNSISMPSTLKTIGKNAFSGCSGISELVIPDKVEKISESSFKDCTSLERLTVPISLNTVVKDSSPAFAGCGSLTEITLAMGTSKGHEYGNNKHTPWHMNESNLKQILIMEGVKSIGKNTFRDCHSLEQLSLPSTLETIGDNAFMNCKHLRDMNLPDSLRTICADAYRGCDNLSCLHFGTGLEEIHKNAFEGFQFYDCDGITPLKTNPSNLNGSTFIGKPDKMIRQNPALSQLT